jgi:hypothetical protein
MTERTTRSESAGVMREIADEIAKRNPGMTPAEAYAAAMSGVEGSILRKHHYELPPDERVSVSKGHWIETAEAAENRETHPAVVELRKKADELQKNAAAVGAPIDAATAFSKACDSEPELRRSYYEG